MKIYILITGNKVMPYVSLGVLCKENGELDKKYVKDNLPIERENLRILESELNEKAF